MSSSKKKKLHTHQKDGNIGNCQIEQEKVGRCPHALCPEGFRYFSPINLKLVHSQLIDLWNCFKWEVGLVNETDV